MKSKPKSLQDDDSTVPDITQSQSTAKETICTVNKAEDLALHARGKIKEFRLAFDRDDNLKGITGSNAKVQRTCGRLQYVCSLFVASGIFITGFVLLTIGSIRMRELDGATEGECRLQDYSTAYGEPFKPQSTWRDLCSACKFVVQMRNDEVGLVNVQSWTMDFEAGFHSGRAEVIDDQFRCCPTKPELDCCNFFEEISGSFCDNFGDRVDGACPSAPWPCYILNMKEKMAEAEQTGSAMHPENLKYGKLGKEKIILGVGIGLFLIGFIYLNILCPCMWHAFRWVIGQRNSARVDALLLRFSKMIPENCRTKKMQRKIDRIDASIVLQRWWKEKMMQIRKRRQSVEIKQMPQHLESAGMFSVSMASESATPDDTTEEDHEHSWANQDIGERMLIANRVHKKILEAKRNPQVGISIAPPPKASHSVGKRLLYDTGNASTSQKLSTHRVLSDPDAKLQRVEVVLLDEDIIHDLKNMLYLPHRGANDTRPRVTKIPKGTVLETLGLAPGHRLTKVGKLLYPSVNGAQLMQAMTGTLRPIFMIFEGVTPPFQNPAWAEKWQKQHIPIPYENPPWATLNYPPSQKDRKHSRKVLPIEFGNDYGNVYDSGPQGFRSSGDIRGSLREFANPMRLTTRSGSLLGSEGSQKHGSQGSERQPLPPAATPPVMHVVNRPSLSSRSGSIESPKTPQTPKTPKY